MKNWNEYRPMDSADYVDLMAEMAHELFHSLLQDNLHHIERSLKQKTEVIQFSAIENKRIGEN